MNRQALPQTKLENKCRSALRRARGLGDLRWVSVRPERTGVTNWTIERIFPPPAPRVVDWSEFKQIRMQLQDKYELQPKEEQLELPFPRD